jgi:hypothetical protein
MDLDAGAVDEQAIRDILTTRQRGKDTLPDAALGPAHEAVVERLLRAIDMLRTVTPAPAALQCMHDPGKYPAIIDPRYPTRIARQQRLDP